MTSKIVSSSEPILLVGGGNVNKEVFDAALTKASKIVAADGGADSCLRFGHMPDAVIGDMDSLSEAGRAAVAPDRVHPIAEQDSTDFDKCLRNIQAPLILGVGFLGARMDHSLAALTVLARRPDVPCVLLDAADVITLCPPQIHLDVTAGTRVSLYPMAPVSGTSRGLHWPIDGLRFQPDLVTGTSNHADGPVRLTMERAAMLLILPRQALDPLLEGLRRAPSQWPARAAEYKDPPQS